MHLNDGSDQMEIIVTVEEENDLGVYFSPLNLNFTQHIHVHKVAAKAIE